MKIIFFGLLFYNLLELSETQSLIGGVYDCPKPWIEFEDRCYKFELRDDTIQGAQETCQRDGASLLSINSLEEHEYIASYLEANVQQSRAWFTSGQRATPTDNTYYWDSDGSLIESYQFWLNNEVRQSQGTRIAYATFGAAWGWTLVTEQDKDGNQISKPYICEISKSNIFKILEQERGFDYGTKETDPTKYQMGPRFVTQPKNVMFDKSSLEKTVVLECVADSNPDAQYEWFKRKELKRALIKPLDDKRITITNGKLTINDPDERIGDNAEYDCVASNMVGAVRSSSAQLNFGYLNDFPKSLRDPIVADAFSGVGIECNPPTHGYPYLLFSWYRDSITNFVRPELKPYTFISNNGKLYFSSVTKDDTGDYFCLVSSPFSSFAEGKVSMPIPLVVQETIGNNKEPQLASGFPAAFPSAPLHGETVRLECFAFGTMSSSKNELFYTWEKVSGPIPAHAIFSDYNRVMTIRDIQLIHGGRYKCTVRRWQGQSSQPGFVEIYVESAPFFTIPLKNKHVDKESDLTWTGIAAGVPQVTYTWYRDAVELKTLVEGMLQEHKDRYVIQNNVLTIKKVNPEIDAGMFQLSAKNSHGTTYSTGQLRILSFPPTFVKYPLQQRQYATLKGNVTLICQPEAAPMGEKVWKKNGGLLSANTGGTGRVQQLPNGNVLIQNVKQDDEGMYTCEVTNHLGSASSSGNLTVLPTTTITQYPLDTSIEVNKTTIFQCQASFNPALDITYDWYHNNRKIEFIKIRIIGETPHIDIEDYFERGTGINRGALYIYRTQYFHAGLYTCVAMTTTETFSRFAKLHVIGPPFQPIGITGFNVATKSIELAWKMGLHSHNGRAITSYIVEGLDEKEGYWKTMKTHIGGDALKTMKTKIDGLSPYSRYRFRVRAENILGLGNPSKPSETYTTAEAPPEIAPSNLRRCIGKVGTLCMEWDAVPLAQQNGNGFSYIVKWKKSYIIDEEWESQTLLGADNTRFVALVGQDNFYQEYDVAVVAFNSKGFSPNSPEITIRSAMGIPTGQPTNLRVLQYNGTALEAEWDPVEDTIDLMKGRLLGYRINYWRDCCETEEIAIFNQIAGQRESGLVIGLYPDTTYWVNVQVYNEAGYGPKNDEIQQNTLRAAPKEAPQEVHVYVEGYNSIRVKWRGVSTGITEEPLSGYRIRFWRQSENRYLSEEREAYKKTNLVVNDLDVNTYYELRVYGYSRGGDGLMSSPIIQFILGPNCFVREDSPEKQYIFKCRGETDSASYLHVSSFMLVLVISIHLILSHL